LDLDGFSLLFLPSSDPGSDPDPALIMDGGGAVKNSSEW
jgi:hypothetical protein